MIAWLTGGLIIGLVIGFVGGMLAMAVLAASRDHD